MKFNQKKQKLLGRAVRRLGLSTAIVTLLTAPSLAQQIKADGTTVTVPTGTVVDTSGQGSPNGFGLYAVNGGLISGSDLSVITNGNAAFGVLAEGAGSEVTITGGSIRTSGDLSSAVATRYGGGTIDLDGVDIYTSGSNSDGVWAQAGGTIRVRNSTIQTDSASTHGVWASGGVVQLTDTQIRTGGTYGVGMLLSDNGTIDAERVTINTQGETSHGVNMASGTLTMRDSDITTTGAGAIGIRSLGGVAVLDNTAIETNGINATGIVAQNSAYVIARDSRVTTAGAGAFGVLATAAGSRADLVDTSIETTGNGAHGIVSQNGSVVYAVNVSVVTGGNGAHGATAIGDGSVVNSFGGSYTTSGFNSAGLEARNGGHLEIDRDPRTGAGTQIHTGGDSAVGVLVQNGTANVTGAYIKTEGDKVAPHWGAVGILATQGGSALVRDTVIETHGEFGDGVNAEGAGSHLDVFDSKITTTGLSAKGAVAFNGGTAQLTNIEIVTDAGNGIVAGDAGSWLNMNGGSIVTKGTGQNGSAAFALRGATVNIDNVAIRTEGDDARGLHAFNLGSTVNATGSEITTIGTGSHGAFASAGGAVNLAGSMVKTEGNAANGLMAKAGSTITATNTVITTTGADSVGISLADDSSARLDNSVVIVENGAALKTESGTVDFELKNGTQVIGNSGVLLSGAAGSDTTLTADGNVSLIGDMIAGADDTNINAALSNNSYWAGAGIGVTGLSLDATSYWKMTGSSEVGSLTNDGVVEFDAANPYKTLTVDTLIVNGGSFILNTKLNEGGAASETDKVIVNGDATGNGLINIRNNGGSGAFTGTGATDGIQVVQVGGESDADFKLGSAAVVGIYDYKLVQADGQNWYLQTEGEDPVGCEETGTCPPLPCEETGTCPIDPPTGHVVDTVPGYNIALAGAQEHVLTALDTFHERVGELRSEEMSDGFHAWTRGIGKTGSYSPKVKGYNGHGFDMTTGGVQIGGDYSLGGVFIPGDKLTLGVFGEYAHSNFDVRGRTATGSISSKGVGAYATWQQSTPTDTKPGTGVYIDAVVKQDWIDFGVSAKSVSGFAIGNSYSGKATSASIETGYGFDLGNNVILQPQAQLTWSKVTADNFTDGNGIVVHSQEAESLRGRLGIRLEKTFFFGDEEEEQVYLMPVPEKTAKGKAKAKGKMKSKVVVAPAKKDKKFVKSVTTFVDANVKHEFKGRNGLIASDTAIGSDMRDTRYDVGVGAVAKVSKNVSLFGRASVEFGGSTDVAGKVSGGLKITW
ncbi:MULTISPECIES: autotransporter outer membrane beta-barrel domain-containing protein [unclassified Phyllobacterium]|uniref:autotransporter outer membrane beta-barrel domain-containing protein n=1 Tax=unclassified Phyllobacterium TaxID=2638441 RepID=UPI003012CACA